MVGLRFNVARPLARIVSNMPSALGRKPVTIILVRLSKVARI
jgi:hypothetical protein